MWHNSFKGVTPLRDILHDRICGVRVQAVNGSVINIFCVYLPAYGCGEDYETTLDELSAILESTEDGSINIIGGDLNGDLGMLGGPRSRNNANKQGKILNRFITKYDYIATNLESYARGPVNTYYGPLNHSCLDYVLIPKILDKCVLSCYVKPEEALNTSDHVPVTLSLDMALIPQVSTECKMKSRTKWGKISDEVLRDRYIIPVSECCDELLTRYVNTIPQPEHVDLILDKLSLCMRECEGSLPKTKPRAHQKSFWSSELSKLKKDKVKCYRDWVREGRPRDSDNQFWVNNKKAKKIFAKRIKEISKKYESDKIEQAISSSELNINQFWRMLKRERTSGKVKVLSIKNKQDEVVHDVSEILETWRSHFSELSTPMISDKFDEDHFNRVTKEVHEFTKTTDLDMFSDVPFEYDEIAKGI